MTEKEKYYLALMNVSRTTGTMNCDKKCMCDECDKQCDVHLKYKEDCLLLENLIKEHFDNPPLKFEELKEEIWIWDNKEKTYIKSCNNYDTKEHGKGIRVQIGFDLVRINYEENRFYRKQVEDE